MSTRSSEGASVGGSPAGWRGSSSAGGLAGCLGEGSEIRAREQTIGRIQARIQECEAALAKEQRELDIEQAALEALKSAEVRLVTR